MEKVIYEEDADDFSDINLADFIAWLQGIAAEQPCPPEEVTVELYQSGDQWDGYDLAKFRITREETPQEAEARKSEWAEEAKRRAEAKERQERAAYEALKAKFG